MEPAHYLSGETIGFRAPALEDAAQAVRWLPGPFPWNAVGAERLLREGERDPWSNTRPLRLVAVERGSLRIVGGAEIEREDHRAAWITLSFAPQLSPAERERCHAEALGILVPWLRDELGFMTVTTALGDDETAAKEAATRAGMAETARLREHVVRPGGRVDLLWFQALNPRRTPRQEGSDAHHA